LDLEHYCYYHYHHRRYYYYCNYCHHYHHYCYKIYFLLSNPFSLAEQKGHSRIVTFPAVARRSCGGVCSCSLPFCPFAARAHISKSFDLILLALRPCFFQTSVDFYRTTRRHVPKDSALNSLRFEKIKKKCSPTLTYDFLIYKLLNTPLPFTMLQGGRSRVRDPMK
jgi:hypothetical protein